MAAPMKMEKIISEIRYFAAFSRVTLLFLQVICNFIIPDHDAGVFNPPLPGYMETQTGLNSCVSRLLGGFRRWDGIYFTYIAHHGYTYENTLAFFPLYPLTVRILANSLFYPLHFILNYSNVILVTSVCVNIWLFVKSAEILYQLGKLVIKNDTIAHKAALLFCISPASIFLSAPYSECLYFYLTLSGLLHLERNKKFTAVIFIGLSFATRSNGALNICYFLYVIFKTALREIKTLHKAASMNRQVVFSIPWIFLTTTVIPYSLLTVLCAVPFVLYQYYCYTVYCTEGYSLDIPDHLIQYGKEKGLVIQGTKAPSWCHSQIPLAYSAIQREYWDQGFLQYWQFKQIPNFILATPVFLLALGLTLSYYKYNRYICLTLGLDEEGTAKKEQADTSQYFQLQGVSLLPYVLHVFALAMFGWFCIHVQVLTRLLFSSCPVLYWYCSHLISPQTPRQPQYNKYDISSGSANSPDSNPAADTRKSETNNPIIKQILNFNANNYHTKLILSYFLGYYVIGTALFSNFLPWT